MARTKSKKTDEERKKQKKEAERRRRARIKADPAKNEQHKAQHLAITLGITSATWNFSESGHGKGAADGIGAVVKRTADSLIAQGHDIPDFGTFVTKMVDRTNIILFTVLESDIADAEKLIPKTLKPIPNTTKIHQITWCCNNPHKLYLRELSCTECLLISLCSHYSLKNNVFDYNLSNSGIHTEEACNQTGINNKEIASKQITSNSSEITTSNSTKDTGHTAKNSDLSVKVGSWVLVQFEGKKSVLHYVGQITSIEQDNQLSFVVKFLRRKCPKSDAFVWQEPEDVSLVINNDIVCVLPEPTPTRRGELIFEFNFSTQNYTIK